MSNESVEQLRAYRLILLALDEIVKSGGQPRYEGDKSTTNREAFRQLVVQYAGGKVSEEAIDEALKVPLQDIAHRLMEVAVKKPD